MISIGLVIAVPTTTAYAPASLTARTSGRMMRPSATTGQSSSAASRRTNSTSGPGGLSELVYPDKVVATRSAPSARAATPASKQSTSARTGTPSSSWMRLICCPSRPEGRGRERAVEGDQVGSRLDDLNGRLNVGVMNTPAGSPSLFSPMIGRSVTARIAATSAAPLARIHPLLRPRRREPSTPSTRARRTDCRRGLAGHHRVPRLRIVMTGGSPAVRSTGRVGRWSAFRRHRESSRPPQ